MVLDNRESSVRFMIKRKQKNSRRRAVERCLALVVSGLILMASISGCALLPKEEELQAAPVLTEGETEEYVMTQVVRGDVVVSDSIRVNYVPASSEKLSFPIGGEVVAHVYVEQGSTVKAGDVLMDLDLTEIDAQIQSQEQTLESLNLELTHLQQSEELDLALAALTDEQNPNATVSSYASVQAGYEQRKTSMQNAIDVGNVRLEELQKQRSQRQLTATIDGTVTSLYSFEEGEATVENQTVATVSDMSDALFQAYSSNNSLLTEGEQYTVNCNGTDYAATALTGAQAGGNGLKADGIYLRLDQPDPSLQQGDTGTVTIVREQSLDTLIVSSAAVQDNGGESVVYQLNEEGFREAVPVTCGLSNGEVTEILEGLEEGDTVILP